VIVHVAVRCAGAGPHVDSVLWIETCHVPAMSSADETRGSGPRAGELLGGADGGECACEERSVCETPFAPQPAASPRFVYSSPFAWMNVYARSTALPLISTWRSRISTFVIANGPRITRPLQGSQYSMRLALLRASSAALAAICESTSWH
jgi:hypothetical protein